MPPPRLARNTILGVATIVVLHFVALLICFEPALSSPDANGYDVQARLLAVEGRSGFALESPAQYVGPHWLSSPEGVYYSKYPPGLGVLMAAAWVLAGPTAALLVNPLLASLTLLALFLIVRRWADAAWGLLAAGLMALNPFANEHALVGDAHTAVAFFLMWGIYALTRWSETSSTGWAATAGLLFGAIPSLRYAEALFLLGSGLFVLLHLGRDRRGLRSALAFGIGAAVPLGALCLRNQLVFGAFWKTGYSLTGEQGGFGWNYFVRYAGAYLGKLLTDGSGPSFLPGLAGIGMLCATAATRKRGVLLAALVLPSTLLYMSYYWPPDPQSMRFLLPTLFLYPPAAVWALRQWGEKQPRAAWWAALALLLLTIAWGLPPSIRSMLRQKFPNAMLAEVTRALERNAPPGSIVIAGEAIQQHLDYLGRWRLADSAILAPAGPRGSDPAAGADDGPHPMQAGKNAERRQRYAGLDPEARCRAFAAEIRQWSGAQYRVYWIGDGEEIDRAARVVSGGERLQEVARVTPPRHGSAPAEPPDDSGRMPGAGPGGGGPHAALRRLMSGGPVSIMQWMRE